MKAQLGLAAVTALTISSATTAAINTTSVNLGTFTNTGGGTINHIGEYDQYISSTAVPGSGTTVHTVVSIDLLGVLLSAGANAIYSVTITDNGMNAYGELSPGADIDLFSFSNFPAGAVVDYVYQGPNATHSNEDPSRWGIRVAALDSFSSAQDQWNLTHLSLGSNGSVTALLGMTLPGGPGNPGDPNVPSPGVGLDMPVIAGGTGAEPLLQISEHGFFESYTVTMEVFTLVPAPGSLALLGAAGLLNRRRRRA